MSLLAPSILAADLAHLADELAACEESGADRIHVDIMDNHFVPNLTMGPDMVAACRRSTSLFLEAHLMVERPDGIIPRFGAAGANLITVHFEACPELHRTVELIRTVGASPGVGINPATPVDSLVDILPEISLALLMTVEPGFGGQPFLTSTLGKVKDLRRLMEERHLDCDIEVDGGVGPDNAEACLEAGATVLVAGTSIFRVTGGTRSGVRCLLELMGRGQLSRRAEA
ncbi:MAG TPA: ribulose-phosphate 3-epimerase [Candidatus Nanopelagicaceae bacterium]|nr:ribulose-phosphate 3-epimerase [Candidatus Nanopelagicaceae bacterium]